MSPGQHRGEESERHHRRRESGFAAISYCWSKAGKSASWRRRWPRLHRPSACEISRRHPSGRLESLGLKRLGRCCPRIGASRRRQAVNSGPGVVQSIRFAGRLLCRFGDCSVL